MRQAVQGISDLITVPGLINLDFADVRTIMRGMGDAVMGTGVAKGENRAVEAAQKAISSPLLEEASIEGARGVIINVTGGEDMSLMEVNEASSVIHEAADDEANIIFGAVVDPEHGRPPQDHGDCHWISAGRPRENVVAAPRLRSISRTTQRIGNRTQAHRVFTDGVLRTGWRTTSISGLLCPTNPRT